MPQETQINGSTENSPNQSNQSNQQDNQADQSSQSLLVDVGGEQSSETTQQEATPSSILEEFAVHASGQSTQKPPGKRPPRGIINPARKFDGLEDDEKILFDQMSNQAYERVYPQYLKAKEYEKELNTLREQNKQLQGS